MKLFLVDDNTKFRETLKTFLEEFLYYEVVGEASDGQEFVDKYKGNADIVLMDINMPGMDGLTATKVSTWDMRDIKIIAVSQYNTMADLKQLIGVGFKGFVSKTRLYDDLDKAIKAIQNNEYYFPNDFEIQEKNK